MWSVVVSWLAARWASIRKHWKIVVPAIGAGVIALLTFLFVRQRGKTQAAETNASVAADKAAEEVHNQYAEGHIAVAKEAASLAAGARAAGAATHAAAEAEVARQDVAATQREAKVQAAGDDGDELEKVLNGKP